MAEKKQRIPRVGAPLTAAEKKMWTDYGKAMNSKTPKSALEEWAGKYDVQLKPSNRVEIKKTYQGDGPAPEQGTTVAAGKCADICHISKFSRHSKVGSVATVMECTLDGCWYDWTFRKWYCTYTCFAHVRMG